VSVAVRPALPLIFDLAAGPVSNKPISTSVLSSTMALRLIIETTATGRLEAVAEEAEALDEANAETLTL